MSPIGCPLTSAFISASLKHMSSRGHTVLDAEYFETSAHLLELAHQAGASAELLRLRVFYAAEASVRICAFPTAGAFTGYTPQVGPIHIERSWQGLGKLRDHCKQLQEQVIVDATERSLGVGNTGKVFANEIIENCMPVFETAEKVISLSRRCLKEYVDPTLYPAIGNKLALCFWLSRVSYPAWVQAQQDLLHTEPSNQLHPTVRG